jgi:DNA/RNA-binding domain of Phe-tRNA-synthetase-like protein
MKIIINKKVFSKHPKFALGFILAKNIQNTNLESTKHLLNEIKILTKSVFNKDNIKSHGLISPYKVLQEEFKGKKHLHTSIETLLKKTLSKKSITSNNSTINTIRYIALKNIVPFGLDDFHKIKGDLKFSISNGAEKIWVLRKLKKGDIYYKDKKSVIASKLDFKKNPRTKVKNHTVSALIHFDALFPITKPKLNAILKETKELLEATTNCQAQIFILDNTNNQIKL